MPARDAAVGLLLLVLADVGLSPEEILVAEGYPHFQATATLLLRDDFELPIERIVQLLDSYAKVSRHIFLSVGCGRDASTAKQLPLCYIDGFNVRRDVCARRHRGAASRSVSGGCCPRRRAIPHAGLSNI